MKTLSHFPALLFLFTIASALSIVVMVYGYGVEVKSFPVVIGVGIIAQAILAGLSKAVIDD